MAGVIAQERLNFDVPPRELPRLYRFRGQTYTASLDGARLGEQLRQVWELMKDGKERTLREIAGQAGAPEASASARLRDLRAMGFDVRRRRRGESGTWVYWIEEYR